MNFFGAFLISYILYSISNNKKNKYIALISLLVSLELFVNVGYAFKIGGYEVLYSELVLAVVVIYSFLLIWTRFTKLDIKTVILSLLFLCSIIITEATLLTNPLDHSIIRQGIMFFPQMSSYSFFISLRMIIIILISISLKSELNEESIYEIVKYIYKFGCFVMIVCLIEWITKNLFNSNIITVLIMKIFGKGEFTVLGLLERDGFYSIQGLMKEPSHLADAIYYSSIIIIISDMSDKRCNNYLLFALLVLLLSRSFTALLYILCIFIIYLTKRHISFKFMIVFIPIVILLFVTFIYSGSFEYYYLRVINSINVLKANDETLLLTSEGERLTSIIYAFKIFTKRPLFGIGLGMPYAYGFLSVFLASVGSFGFITWYLFVFNAFGNVKLNIKTVFIIIAIFLAWLFNGSMVFSYNIITLLLVYEIGMIKPIKINSI